MGFVMQYGFCHGIASLTLGERCGALDGTFFHFLFSKRNRKGLKHCFWTKKNCLVAEKPKYHEDIQGLIVDCMNAAKLDFLWPSPNRQISHTLLILDLRLGGKIVEQKNKFRTLKSYIQCSCDCYVVLKSW